MVPNVYSEEIKQKIFNINWPITDIININSCRHTLNLTHKMCKIKQVTNWNMF